MRSPFGHLQNYQYIASNLRRGGRVTDEIEDPIANTSGKCENAERLRKLVSESGWQDSRRIEDDARTRIAQTHLQSSRQSFRDSFMFVPSLNVKKILPTTMSATPVPSRPLKRDGPFSKSGGAPEGLAARSTFDRSRGGGICSG